MSKLKVCAYNGGRLCERQGGDGSKYHADGYVHPFPTAMEVDISVDASMVPVQKSENRAVIINGLEEKFDEELAKSVLSLEFSDLININNIAKSMTDFDLDSAEGINRLLEVLPIMDPEIMSDIMEEIWPGYVSQDSDPYLMRAEIKGYLLDYLKGQEDKVV